MTVSISLVTPVYCGESYLVDLVDAVHRLRDELTEQGAPFAVEELILVDDAAIDGSAEAMDALAHEFPWVTCLHLSRNFGQHPATTAGIMHSAGDWIVTLDEDLQHPPDRVPDLLRCAVTQQADICYARPRAQVHKSVLRDTPSRAFKALMKALIDNPNLREVNSFRLVRGSIGRAACAVMGHDTYLDIGLAWFTQRIVSLELDMQDKRYIETGRSGYTFRSLLSHAWRMLFSSHIKALRMTALLGFAVTVLAFLGAAYFLVLRLLRPEMINVQGWTSLFLTISFLGGVIIMMLGVALQYLSTMVLRAHGKPTFFVVDRSDDAALTRWFEDRAQ